MYKFNLLRNAHHWNCHQNHPWQLPIPALLYLSGLVSFLVSPSPYFDVLPVLPWGRHHPLFGTFRDLVGQLDTVDYSAEYPPDPNLDFLTSLSHQPSTMPCIFPVNHGSWFVSVSFQKSFLGIQGRRPQDSVSAICMDAWCFSLVLRPSWLQQRTQYYPETNGTCHGSFYLLKLCVGQWNQHHVVLNILYFMHKKQGLDHYQNATIFQKSTHCKVFSSHLVVHYFSLYLVLFWQDFLLNTTLPVLSSIPGRNFPPPCCWCCIPAPISKTAF